MSKYTTTTAALKATTADIRTLDAKNIKLNGEQIPSKVLDERGDFVTDQDLWGTTVTTDENGVVHVSHKFLNSSDINVHPLSSVIKSIKDNKAYTSADASGEPYCNIQTEMIKDGTNMFNRCASLTTFSSDLHSLTNGESMFTNCNSLESCNGNLRSLVVGSLMFMACTKLTSLIDSNLSNLVHGTGMFSRTSLTEFRCDLSNLVIGEGMFVQVPLTLFSSNVSSLNLGASMFFSTALTSFSGDLSSLVNGSNMFRSTPLTSFSGNLSSLTDGSSMFRITPITSFSEDLSSLTNGSYMFCETSITSFSEDLSSLTNGSYMFSNTHKRGYTILHYKMVDNVRTQITEHFKAEGLTSFSGDLGSLQTGYGMFGDGSDVTYTNEEGVTETTKNITPLDEQSVMIIADTIKDLNGFTNWDRGISSSQRGIIHIGYDSAVCDIAKIEEYCTEIMNKGWTVYLNGTLQTTDEGIEGLVTTDEDGSITVTPVPYYCKPVEVDQKDANWTDGEKYYIILGAQKVFGDDLSTYGMFTSIENAAMNMGFTPYEYIEEKTVEEN